MRWKKYGVEMDVTGITRKAAAEILADLFQTDYKFQSEDNSYEVKDGAEKTWRIFSSDSIKAERYNGEKVVGANYMYQVKLLSPFLYENEFPMLEKALEQLELRGAIVNDSTKMNLLLDVSGVENWEQYQTNLGNLSESKGELFQKALGVSFAQVADTGQEKGIISFPYFKSTLHQKELLSDIQFAQIVSSFVENNRTVSQKKSENQNDKFMMRTWLVRAGMVGEEYKFARKMLTKNLEGNSAWQKMIEPAEIQTEEQTEDTATMDMEM
ncbi:amidoligase family protein [Anaerotignum lactatifermentans]|uniref:Amidoligase family protein n=1 Tax=Anaerotignum lactatifermentans TaxID=160404 RepID=A0ABS2GBK1_9FIRM|nr:amidoligase family protein [Anaerotignum lactatifermentans]MBM6830317.1 amidoligase family protein [Anaerotignum lactatifermentans]MBM6878871.1 amidoligase family protein [Anaerotignum lactatifermentans]MBM6951991.1 amidoligase family protein [Anaerotignum lactatifermentans]